MKKLEQTAEGITVSMSVKELFHLMLGLSANAALMELARVNVKENTKYAECVRIGRELSQFAFGTEVEFEKGVRIAMETMEPLFLRPDSQGAGGLN